jgi:hypothetical protein
VGKGIVRGKKSARNPVTHANMCATQRVGCEAGQVFGISVIEFLAFFEHLK